MKLNRFFSLNRFARLLKYDLLINQRLYLLGILGMGIIAYGFIWFFMYMGRSGFNSYEDYFPVLIMYFMGLLVLVGTAFPALNNSVLRGNYFLLPASIFEKFLVQFVIRVVLVTFIGMGLFWVGAHLAKASMVPNPLRNYDPSIIPDFSYANLFEELPSFRDRLAVILSGLSCFSIAFAGATFFNRFALVKTLIVVAITIGLLIVFFVLLSHLFYPDVVSGFDIFVREYRLTDDLINIQLYFYMLAYSTWLFFLPLAYMKLKEKEI
ncbi:hypothetical protein [Sunxiuqinia elliptica]|uniref:ABC-2 family transporter n=1 Tax=Sunxiuqinia elliptica TaxID=655355 RepID=A0A1I2A4Q5_9BACT|nr:hypothetical protein [Sunxiuqinia elliptica]SFE38787.1 hypothetical protein SAMN05216283_10118 [Sunxiuqinia elliptica]